MNDEVEVQLHLWPWSVGIREETVDLMGREAEFPFMGSPVVSVSTTTTLFLSQRHERFSPFGPAFRTVGGHYQLYETPHGVMASRKKGSSGEGTLLAYSHGGRMEVRLRARGARSRQGGTADGETGDSPLCRTVLAWSQFFDTCLEVSRGTRREGKLHWKQVLELIHRASEEAKEPRMSLIVDIARHMHRRIGHAVAAARKVLMRERRLLPAGRIEETDTACLKWYVRQPGETMAQKAAANRQALMGVARKENYDTLENKVLKDFLVRCRREAARYMATEVGSDLTMQGSIKARETRIYERLCSLLVQAPHLEGVALPSHGVRPNYVLQNDLRYREVWKYYQRLLRQEDEEDRVWDWQARTWADVARLLVNATLYLMAMEDGHPGTRLRLREMLTSMAHVSREQHVGSRVAPGAEPGPFEVWLERDGRESRHVLEVVHPQEAGAHRVTAGLGRLGGHLYLVLTPLEGGRRTVVVMWAVHSAGAEHDPVVPEGWEAITESAKRALHRHAVFLEERNRAFPDVLAFIVASHIGSVEAELHCVEEGGVPLLQVGADRSCWDNALAGMAGILEHLLESVL